MEAQKDNIRPILGVIPTQSFKAAILAACMIVSSWLGFSLKAENVSTIVDSLEVKVLFPVRKTHIQLDYMGNAERLYEFFKQLNEIDTAKDLRISRVDIVGYASPEGPYDLNQRLARQRAESLAKYLVEHSFLPDSLIAYQERGIDWGGLTKAVMESNMEYKAEVLAIIHNEPEITYEKGTKNIIGSRKQKLMELEGGRPWRWMMNNFYPYLRSAASIVCYVYREVVPEPEIIEFEIEPADTIPAVVTEPVEADTIEIVAEESIIQPTAVSKPQYWSLHTNMLYDLAAIPNIGAEVYPGKNFSLAANWWYAWWKTDRKHRYWRTYGGYIAPRYWFGQAAKAKPLTGHHIGVYAQIMLYDFEWGGTGYLSGTPHKNIFHHPTWGGGIEYGFALPIKRRLNIDFTIGLGYLQGRYWKYEPQDNHYVWLSVHNRNWWGITKAEISLVWLLGRDNINKKKGGAQ